MRGTELANLVRDYELQRRSGPALLAQVGRHVRRLAGRYPHGYFELGRRDEGSLDSLTNRVFSSCARTPKGRFPFRDRTPFRAYVEEEFDDAPIRHHTVYARLSIAREILRDDYARNLSRDPELRRRDELYRALGPLLEAQAEPVPQGQRPPLWQLPGAGPSLARPPEVVIRRLRQEGAADLPPPALVRRALALLGQPISRSRLTHLLAEVLPAADTSPPEPAPQADLPTALAVRAAVRRAWDSLEDLDRALLIGLSRGEPADALMARDPRLRHRVAVTRAVSRVGDHFVRAVVTDLGVEAAPKATPRALVERVLAVLIEVLPELESARVA